MYALSHIAARLGARLEGSDAQMQGMAPLDTAGPHDLSLCTDNRQAYQLKNTAAAAVLLHERSMQLKDMAPCSVLLVSDVRLAMAAALSIFYPDKKPEAGVEAGALVEDGALLDPSARVEPGAQVGAGARVGAGTVVGRCAVVMPGAKIGQSCVIGQGAVIFACCTIGDRVVVGPGCILGSDGFGLVQDGPGLRRIPQVGSVLIGDDVELGANCTVDRGTLGPTRIGNGTKIDNLVQVGHNVTIGRFVCIAAQSGLAGSATVKDGAVLGGQVGVADHVTVGSGAQVGAKSGVGTNVSDGARVAGYPAVDVHRWLESVFGWRRVKRLLKDKKDKP